MSMISLSFHRKRCAAVVHELKNYKVLQYSYKGGCGLCISKLFKGDQVEDMKMNFNCASLQERTTYIPTIALLVTV